MPVLKDPKHEAFAQAVADGKSAREAYEQAGYERHDGNASRLRSNEKVASRIAELLEKRAKSAQSVSKWEAATLFERMNLLIDKSVEAGDFKAAMDGQKFVLKCFGYEDSPTLTHEHVGGKALKQAEAEKVEDDQGKKVGEKFAAGFKELLKAHERAKKA